MQLAEPMKKLPKSEQIDETTFMRYHRNGTRYAALGSAGSIYLLMALAASAKITTFLEIHADQIPGLCEHILNPSCRYSCYHRM